MVTRTGTMDRVTADSRDQEMVAVYGEGIRAGLAGAVAIAVWFLVLDILHGRPLYTPTVLGTAVFRGVGALTDPASLRPSLEMVVSFTWIHTLIFVLFGMAAAWLIGLAERDSHYGFGILLLFAIFQSCFIFACMLFFEPVLHALTWQAIIVGNLLAAAAMAAVFWRRHHRMVVQP